MLYEKLDVWKRSRSLTIEVYKLLENCRDYGFKDQITRSSLSVPSNIAEGCERESIKERVRFFDFAKGSLGEFVTQVDIGAEIGFIPKERALGLIKEGKQLSKMLHSLMTKLKAQY
jgi:four helix bundle protein